MSTQIRRSTREIIPAGNDFTLYIHLDKWDDGQYRDFDLHTATDLRVYLICAVHNTEIDLDYTITSSDCLKCDVDYRLLHINTSYGVVVEGYDAEDKHFRWTMMPREGLLVVPNTSGMNTTDDVEEVDLQGRVGWGITSSGVHADWDETDPLDPGYIKHKPDLSIYLTAEDIEGKQDTLVSGQNIKTINNISLLGSGNINIQGGGGMQVQADWNESNTSSPAYIQNKPDMNNYVESADLPSAIYNEMIGELQPVAFSGDYDDLANKPDLSDYQELLVSGTNIKTINNQSLLGSGDITINEGEDVIFLTYGITNDIPDDLFARAIAGARVICYYYIITGATWWIEGYMTGQSITFDKTYSILDDGIINIYLTLSKIDNRWNWNKKNVTSYSKSQVDSITNGKQDTLVSGTNIKTINNQSLLGSGNITIGGSGVQADWAETDTTDPSYIQNKPDMNDYVEADALPSMLDNELRGILNPIAFSGDYNDLQNQPDLSDYQELLVSGTNIKTINNQSLLGSGNITISGSGVQADWAETDTTDPSYIQNKPDMNDYVEQNDLPSLIYNQMSADLNQVAFTGDYNNLCNQPDLSDYQELLVSGTNIKTINNQSLLGSGNITISGSGVQADWAESDSTDPSYIQNKPDLSNYATQADLSNYATQTDLADYQELLVSGTNIKTINNKSLLGSGDITISGGGDPGFIKVTNANKTGLVSSLATNYSTNIGQAATIEGDSDGINGYKPNTASGDYSHSEGSRTTASNKAAHAEGYQTTASGQFSHAEGGSSEARANYSHAEGSSTITSGENSHAEGGGTKASGVSSHAEGSNSEAQANYSHAEGYYTIAKGQFSHTEGNQTETNNQYEHAEGKFNLSSKANNNEGDSGNTLSSIGNGIFSGGVFKHNAFEVRQNGDIYYSDTEKIDGSTVHYYDAPMRKLQDAMVTSTTNGVKIEVVNALPATPDSNTLYVVI